ncbi:MAG: hypothetical protein M3O30_18985 [Planctomycetota bacterium]|nr:hypothetical protein [Planctomycetota bacterium]
MAFKFGSRRRSGSAKASGHHTIRLEGLESRLLFAVDATVAFVAKGEGFTQTSDTTVVTAGSNDLNPAFGFSAGVYLQAGGALNSASVTLPNLAIDTMGSRPAQNAWSVPSLKFASKSQMDASVADGPYHFMIDAVHDGVHSISLGTPGDAYSTAPQIPMANYDALQNVDPTVNTTVNWNQFSNGTNADFIQLVIQDVGKHVIYKTPRPGDNGALNGDVTSTQIPAGVLTAATSYTGDLYFYKVAESDFTTYPGVEVAEVFGTATSFPIIATNSQGSLNAPGNVAASAGTFAHHVQLTWDSVSGAASYQVYRSTTNNINVATKIAGGFSSNFFNDTSATPGVQYFYWVRGRNPSTIGPFSSTAAAGFVPLAAPTGVAASQGTFPHHVQITWAAVTNASAYQVFRSTTNDINTSLRVGGGFTSTFFNDNTAAHGQTYFYWVKARNSATGPGLASASVSGFIP